MENVVTKGAKSADPMPKLSLTTPGQTGSYEDLGGPTPENSKPDDDSNKLKTPGTTLKQVKDIVSKGAKPADPMPASGIPVEDLGGPTPENYKPDDDSAKLKDPAATLAQVKDVVNAKAMKAEEAESEEYEEVIEEEEETTDEVVAEDEYSDEEAVSYTHLTLPTTPYV